MPGGLLRDPRDPRSRRPAAVPLKRNSGIPDPIQTPRNCATYFGINMPSLPLLLTLLLAAPSALGIRRSMSSNTVSPAATSRPSYIECQSSSECEADHCCVLGGDRYSIPTCRPMQALGDVCRPSGHKPFNTTVGYPDQSSVELSVFWLFCPCADGLFCQRESHSCQASY